MVKMMGSFTMPLLEPRRQPIQPIEVPKINPQRFHLGRTNRNLLRYTTVSLAKKAKSMAKSQDLKPRHQLLGLSVSQFHLWHHWSWWISCRRPGAYHLRICAFLGLGFPNFNIQKPLARLVENCPSFIFSVLLSDFHGPQTHHYLYHLSGRLVQLLNPCPTIISGYIWCLETFWLLLPFTFRAFSAISLVTFGKRIKFHPPGPVYSGAPVVTPMAGGSLPRHLVVGNLGQRWIQSMSFCLGWNGIRPLCVSRKLMEIGDVTRTLKLTAAATPLKNRLFIPKEKFIFQTLIFRGKMFAFGEG